MAKIAGTNEQAGQCRTLWAGGCREQSGQSRRLVMEGTQDRMVGRDLAERRQGGARKLRMALRLRKETTMTLAWIAQRLPRGTWLKFWPS